MISTVLNSLGGNSSLIFGKLTLEQNLVGRIQGSNEIESDDNRPNNGAMSNSNVLISDLF
jgi:hypothetical protein